MDRSNARLWRDVLAIALLWSAITIVFGDVLFLRRTFFDRDLVRFYYPTKRILHDIVSRGEFPVWNPYYSAGQPLAANPEYELFYPLQAFIYLPDFHLGFNLHILSHLYLASAAMFLFLRSRALSIAASVWGAIAFTFGGYLLSTASSLLPLLFGTSWIPVILLFTTRLVSGGRWIDYALASAAVGVQALSGEPTTLAQTWVLAIAFAAWAPGADRPSLRAAFRGAMLGVAVVITGIGVGSVQILPAFDLMRDIVRSDPFPFERVSLWSMHPLRPLEWIYPHLFGIASAEVDQFWGHRLYPALGYPFILNLYFGVSAIALAFGGFVARLRSWGWMLAITAISYVAAIGSHTPLLRLMYDAGLFSSMRYPEKFILMGVVTLTIFSAMGFDAMRSGNRMVARAALGFVAVASAIATFLAISCRVAPNFKEEFLEFWRLPEEPRTLLWAQTSSQAWIAAAVGGVIVLLLLILCAALPRLGYWPLIAALLLDLSRLSAVVAPRVDEGYFSMPPLASFLDRNAKEYRLFHQAEWHESSGIGQHYLETPGARYWVFRNGMSPRTAATWGFQTVLEHDYDRTNLKSTERFVQAMWNVREAGQRKWAEMFMTMSNAWYRGLYRPPAEGLAGRSVRDIRPIVFVKSGEPPRYHFARRIVSIKSPEDFERQLISGNWSPDTAFVAGRTHPAGRGRVLGIKEQTASVQLEVEADDDALLVLSITNHRYWTALVDDRAVPTVDANLTYIGVPVPKGRHTVVVCYRNPWILYSALSSLSVILALVVVPVIRKRSESRAP